MLDAIIKLIEESGAGHVNLRVSVSGEDATVIVNTTLKPLARLDGLSQQFIDLREALSTPLVLKGNKAQMDIDAGNAILSLTETVSDSVKEHNNLAEVAQSVSVKKNSKTIASIPQASPSEASDENGNQPFIEDDATSL